MEQIKTLESFMSQQKDRKNFVEHDDLKVLEQHLADYLTLQTESNKDKDLQNVSPLRLKSSDNYHNWISIISFASVTKIIRNLRNTWPQLKKNPRSRFNTQEVINLSPDTFFTRNYETILTVVTCKCNEKNNGLFTRNRFV